jgi:adenylate kinase family enzyme
MSVAGVADLLTARRIVVYGVTGSGKSTLSRIIAERRGLPHIPTDELGWGPGWTALDPEPVDRMMDELTSGDSWVADSFWGRTTAELVPKVDLMIGLDLPRRLTFWRLLRRTARRIRTKELVCNGNVETLPRALGRDSILRWHARTWRSKSERIRRWEADPLAPPVLRVTRPGEVAALVAVLPAATSA